MRIGEKLFKQYERLLWKKAHSFSKTTGHDVDELFAVACLAFVEKTKNYNSNKGKFSTYLTWVVNSALCSYLQKEKMQNAHCEVQDDMLIIKPLHNEHINLRQRLSVLGVEAREVCEILFECPFEFLNLLKGWKRHHLRTALFEYFKKQKGWSRYKFEKTLKEVQAGTK